MVTLRGRTLVLPISVQWTGQITLNVITGHLARRHHKLAEEQGRCADCGSRKIVDVTFVTGQDIV